MIIPSHGVSKVPTGVGVLLPDGYDIVVHCKSGLSTKGIWAANAPVDAGYTGEIHAILYNTTDEDFTINKGDKIGQFVVRPVIYADFVEELDQDPRGANGFGSTGR
jgi:dUTP pyrophosphatase